MAKAKTNKQKGKKQSSKVSKQTDNLPTWLTNRWLVAGALFVLSMLIYSNTITHEYTQDDAIVIYENEFTTQGFAGLTDLRKYDTFRGFFKKEGKANLVSGGRYRPFTPMMFAVGLQLFGSAKKDDKGTKVKHSSGNTVYETDVKKTKIYIWFHFMNVLLYGLLCAVLYLLLLKLFAFRWQEGAPLIALMAAIIFATHPVHTEVVANIKGRDEIMTLLGSLSALYFSIKAWEEKKLVWLLPTALLFFVGLLSKENAITFLAIVPMTFWVFTKASVKDIAVQTAPYVLVALVFLGIRASALAPPPEYSKAQIEEIKNRPKDLMNDPFQKLDKTKGIYVPLTEGERTATVFHTLTRYAGLMLVPYPLTHDYYPRHIEVHSWSSPTAILGLLLALGLGIFGVMRVLKRDPLGYGILFYIITLSIVSNLFFSIGTNMAERFVFMPSVGFAIAISVLLTHLIQTKNTLGTKLASYSGLILTVITYLLFSFNQNERSFIVLLVGLSIIATLALIAFLVKQSKIAPWIISLSAIALIFSSLTFFRNFAWKDNFTLFMTDVAVSSQSAKLQNSVGGELITQAIKPQNASKKEAMLKEAIVHLNEAVKYHPGYKNAYLLMGNAQNYLKNFDESIKAYQTALKMDPTYEEADNNLGITYRDAGKYWGEEKGNLDKSLQYLKLAYDKRPADYEVVRLLGVANGAAGNAAKARGDLARATEFFTNSKNFFTKTTQLDPNNADAWYDLGTSYYFLGDDASRAKYHQKALEINPNYLEERKQRQQ